MGRRRALLPKKRKPLGLSREKRISPHEGFTEIALKAKHSGVAMKALGELNPKKHELDLIRIAIDSRHESVASTALKMFKKAKYKHSDIPQEIDGMPLGDYEKLVYCLGRGKGFSRPHEEGIRLVRFNRHRKIVPE